MSNFLPLMFDALKKSLLRGKKRKLQYSCQPENHVTLSTYKLVCQLMTLFFRLLYLLLKLFCVVKNITHLSPSLPMSTNV